MKVTDAFPQPPGPCLLVTPNPGFYGEPVNFSAGCSTSPDATITSYEWDFGDGTTATGFTVGHTYIEPGTYAVSLTLSDDRGSRATATQQVTMNRRPGQPFATASPVSASGKAPLRVTFTGAASVNEVGLIVGYAWDFGDGNQGSGVTPNHTYYTPGTYQVLLTLTDNSGLMDWGYATVTVQPNEAGIQSAYSNFAEGSMGSQSTSDHLDDPGTSLSNQEFGLPFIAGASGSVDSWELVAMRSTAFASSSLRRFSLRANRVGPLGTGTGDIPDEVNPALEEWNVEIPEAKTLLKLVSRTRPTLIQGTKYWLVGHINPTGNARDFWTQSENNPGSGVGRSSTTANWAVKAFGSLPTSRVKLLTAPVNAAPVAVLGATPLSGPGSPDIQFSSAESSDPDGSVVTYAWDFGDGTAGSGLTASHTYAAGGSYTAVLTVTDDQGDTAAQSVAIAVTANQPPVSILLSSPAIPENKPAETPVGTFATTDPDPDDSIVLELLADLAPDGAAFELVGSELRARQSFNYEAKGTYAIRVRATDLGGNTLDVDFILQIENLTPEVFQVTSANDSGQGSFRQAILDANACGDIEAKIQFACDLGEVNILPGNPLPPIAVSVEVNASTGNSIRPEICFNPGVVVKLTGADDAFTGHVPLQGATLVIGDNGLFHGSVTVRLGGKVTGTGALGTLTLNSGGTIAPGSSPGTIASGTTTWNGGVVCTNGKSTTRWQLPGQTPAGISSMYPAPFQSPLPPGIRS